MHADFLDAHRRHLRDADFLLSASRLANADHLYGMAAECGLKRLMLAFDMATRPSDGAPVNIQDRAHVDKLWVRYETYRSGRVDGVQLGLPSSTPFDDWCVSQRYAHEDGFDRARVAPHQTGAHAVHALVKKAERAGLL
jgi:hypothetical protein